MISVGRSDGEPSTRVLVVDDDESFGRSLCRWLCPPEFLSCACTNGANTITKLRAEPFDVVISDVRMDGMDGLSLLRHIRHAHPLIEVILLTGFGTIPDAVSATKWGAFDYLSKHIDTFSPEECARMVREATARKRRRERRTALRQRRCNGAAFKGLAGQNSPAMREALEKIQRAAGAASMVLLTGETGTGKSLVAERIHQHSKRSDKPFVSVDCGALPANLAGSELFGHVKGAFTGAVRDKMGVFEQASGGTIFLDEIGNLTPEHQKLLLRVLQTQIVRRVGSTRDVPVDVRVIAATNVDLRAAVASCAFREDLFFRLKVIEVRLPSLYERREDIAELAYHFLHRFERREDRKFSGISDELLDALERHKWPGNVRELENVIEVAVAFEDGEELTLAHLPAELLDGGRGSAPAWSNTLESNLHELLSPERSFREASALARYAFCRAYLLALLARHRTISAAARAADMDRPNFKRELRKFDIDPMTVLRGADEPDDLDDNESERAI